MGEFIKWLIPVIVGGIFFFFWLALSITRRNQLIETLIAENGIKIAESELKLKKEEKKRAENRMEIAKLMSELEYQIKLAEISEHDRRLAAIGELTQGIAHEFGQPVTNIRYTIQFYQKLFEKTAITKEEVFKIFDSILEETERMGRLVKRLSPITSNKSTIESFDLIDLIQKRVKAENIRLNELKIEVNISPVTPVYIVGDPVKYDQIISNLLLNAIDAIGDQKNLQTNRIDIQVEDTGDEIKIIFADTGVGIQFKDKNKVFDPFFTTKPPGKGEGLGLFIVWNLLKMHGGKIEADNSYDNGARFLISIPKQTDDNKEV